jgi:hypothetical protein
LALIQALAWLARDPVAWLVHVEKYDSRFSLLQLVKQLPLVEELHFSLADGSPVTPVEALNTAVRLLLKTSPACEKLPSAVKSGLRQPLARVLKLASDLEMQKGQSKVASWWACSGRLPRAALAR